MNLKPELRERAQVEAQEIRTVQDLLDYAEGCSSTTVGLLISQPLRFFMEDCAREGGRRDWKAIKARKKLGLKRRLKPDDLFTAEVSRACSNWRLQEARDVGTSFAECSLSQRQAGIADPRAYVLRLLQEVVRKNEDQAP